MPIGGSDRAKIIAFEWGGDTYLFEGGRFAYRPAEDREEWQYSNREHDFQFNAIDFYFTVFCGYLDQQLNADGSYELADATVIAQAPAVGVVDILNILKESNSTEVYYYPKLEDGYGVVNQTKYRVVTDQSQFDLMKAERGGRFTPYVPVSFKAKSPLSDYPDWANR